MLLEWGWGWGDEGGGGGGGLGRGGGGISNGNTYYTCNHPSLSFPFTPLIDAAPLLQVSSLPTSVLTNVCIVTPDTVGRLTCVTVGGTTREHGVGQRHYLIQCHAVVHAVRAYIVTSPARSFKQTSI